MEQPTHDQIQASVVTLKGLVLNKPVEFIIDSGAEKSVIPVDLVPQTLIYPSEIKLNDVEGKSIQTFGHFNAVIGVPSLRRKFKINFVVTKTQPILVADFLIAYNLNLNMGQKKLCHPVTQLSATLKSKKIIIDSDQSASKFISKIY